MATSLGASAWSSSAIGTLATWGAIRSFSPPSAALGGEVVVTITASGYGPFGGIMETLPAGFSYVSSSLPDDSVTVNGQEVTFSLLGETDFTYTVAAPSAEGSYSFSGVLTSSDRAEVPVGGAITIAVTTGDPLIARYDANGNSMIERGEVIAAINDYIFGEGDGVISRSDVIRLITLYIFAPSTPHNRPGAPTGLTAVGNGQTRIDLSWSAPPSDGGSAITGYRIEVSENGSTWIDLVANTRNPATSYSHTGLTAGSTRHYRVSAINSAGTGPVSNIATGTAAGDAATDRAALVALYNATDGANWLNNGNWLSNAPMGEWHGVTTDSDGRVTQLILDNNQLTGEISAELGSLSSLTVLDLHNNQLTGEIPAELGNLTNLELLDLGYNRLTGEIPAELGSLTNLTHLYLYRNQLTGEIPAELGSLTSLETLYLTSNQLSGEIPAELGSLTSLEGLSLNDNQLTGTIPAELGSLSNLTGLSLYSNHLTGEIPAELGSLTSLEELWLGGNQLTGEIPAELGGLSNLTGLSLHSNQLTGEIPAELGGLSNLTGLSLYSNHLTGEIPAELGSLSNLTYLYLFNNQLTGEIPAELGNLTNLRWLYLQGNQLTGCIPEGLRDVPDNDLDELGLDDCVSAAASGESKASFQNFHVIDVELDEYGDHDRECRTRLGSKYRLADWNDLKDYYTSGGSIPELIAGLNWKDENTSDVGVRGPRVARNGEVRFGSRRHYFVSRHDHAPPGYFLVHDDIDDYHLSLGSWYGQGGEALCYKTG